MSFAWIKNHYLSVCNLSLVILYSNSTVSIYNFAIIFDKINLPLIPVVIFSFKRLNRGDRIELSSWHILSLSHVRNNLWVRIVDSSHLIGIAFQYSIKISFALRIWCCDRGCHVPRVKNTLGSCTACIAFGNCLLTLNFRFLCKGLGVWALLGVCFEPKNDGFFILSEGGNITEDLSREWRLIAS